MKKINQSIVIIICLFTLFSCTKNNTDDLIVNQEKTINTKSNSDDNSSFFKENVALLNSRIRSVSEKEYVRELVFINFSKEETMSSSITFDKTSFFDDGSYNDIKANDGIYTSAAKFKHTKKVPFFKDFPTVSVMKSTIVDKKFAHAEELEKINSEYDRPPFLNNTNGNVSLEAAAAGVGVTIECDVEFGTCGCYADEWGWCDCCCVTISNCKVSVSLSVGIGS